MTLLRMLFLVISLLCIASCGNHAFKTNTDDITDGLTTLSTSASNAMSVVRSDDGAGRICVRLGPDATFNSQANVNFSLTSSSEGGGEGENEDELIGRSVLVVFMRDAIYNLCIANLNGTVSDAQYLDMMGNFYKEGFKLLKNEIANEAITVNESSASSDTVSPINTFGGRDRKENDRRSSSNSNLKSENKGCDASSVAMKWKVFKKSALYDSSATYDCREMSDTNLIPKKI